MKQAQHSMHWPQHWEVVPDKYLGYSLTHDGDPYSYWIHNTWLYRVDPTGTMTTCLGDATKFNMGRLDFPYIGPQ